MHAVTITAEHWQAALDVPKQIALDLSAQLNLRLQASRMVQSMLKVLLKHEKDRSELKQLCEKNTSTPQPEKRTGAMPRSAWACAVTADTPSKPTSQEPFDKHNEVAPLLASTHQEHVHEGVDVAPAENLGMSVGMANESPPGASEPSEPRTRYIGRVGPRKIRGKKRK